MARKVYLWNVRSSRWGKKCIKMVDRSGMLVRWVHRPFEGRENVCEWRMMNRSREGLEWDERKWKSEIERAVKCVGLSKWKNELERKKSLEWYKEKEAPKYVKWYEESLGGDLLF